MKKFVNYIMQTEYSDIKVYFDKKQKKLVGRQIGKNHCKQVLYYKNGDNKSGRQYMFYPIQYVLKCFGHEYKQKIFISEENMKKIKNNFRRFIEEHKGKRYLTTLKTFEKQ